MGVVRANETTAALKAIPADPDGLLPPAPLPSLTSAFSRRRAVFGPLDLPQTALSNGFGPAVHDFANVVDIASLADAQRLHMRRQAMDAVDHLIALLDALDAENEDREPDTDAEGFTDEDDDKSDAEPILGWPNDFRVVLSNVAGADLDVEEVNEDGAGAYDLTWWERSSHPPMGVGAHV